MALIAGCGQVTGHSYGEKLVGSVPEFPLELERSITIYLNPGPVETAVAVVAPLAGIVEETACSSPEYACTFSLMNGHF